MKDSKIALIIFKIALKGTSASSLMWSRMNQSKYSNYARLNFDSIIIIPNMKHSGLNGKLPPTPRKRVCTQGICSCAIALKKIIGSLQMYLS